MPINIATLTASSRYFVSGQPITSSTLNQHASLYFSSENSFVIRGLNGIKSGNTVTITPGACVVNGILVSVNSEISFNSSSLSNLQKYYAVISYPNPCYNTYPVLEIVQENELNTNTMCVLFSISYGEITEENRIVSDIQIDTISALPLTMYFDAYANKFKIKHENYDFELIDLFVNGIRLVKNDDYYYNNNTKTVTLSTPESLEIKNISVDIFIKNAIFSSSTTLLMSQISCIEVLDIVNEPDTQLHEISLPSALQDLYIEVFKNGQYLYTSLPSSNDYSISNNKITFISGDITNEDTLNIIVGSKSIYDPFLSYKFVRVCGITSTTISTMVITTPYTVDNVYAFINGLFRTVSIINHVGNDYTVQFTPALSSNTKYAVFLSYENSSGVPAEDLTKYMYVTSGVSGDISILLSFSVVFGEFCIFKNGLLLNPNKQYSYNYSNNNIKVFNCTVGDQIHIFYR